MGIVEAWRENRALHDVMVFLQANGVLPWLAARIVKRCGPRAAQIVADEPYRLALEVAGIGFRTADRIAESVGVARDSPLRHQAALLQAARRETEKGHTFTPEVDLFVATRALLQDDVPTEDLARGLHALVLGGHAYVDVGGTPGSRGTSPLGRRARGRGAPREALVPSRRASPIAASTCPTTTSPPSSAPRGGPLGRTAPRPRGRAKVPRARRDRGPGVGKTTLLSTILALFRRGRLIVRLSAPTGARPSA
ncbi:MAG: hypothetical protein IPK71_11885 [Myxococcales bacterium]|nr:hypothetical protein [Myxococcales bacterium]